MFQDTPGTYKYSFKESAGNPRNPPAPSPKSYIQLAMLNKLLITIAAVIFALLSVVPASAKIGSISVPNRPIHPGDHFQVTFHTTNWIINVDEYYVVFGIELEPATHGGLEQLLGTGYDLVAHGHSNSGVGSFDVPLQIPKSLKPPHNKAKYRLTAAVFITVRIACNPLTRRRGLELTAIYSCLCRLVPSMGRR